MKNGKLGCDGWGDKYLYDHVGEIFCGDTAEKLIRSFFIVRRHI
jgi:hypothetical protein